MKVKLIKDCTNVHSKLIENSVHEIFMEKEKYYILRVEEMFCGIYKENVELLED